MKRAWIGLAALTLTACAYGGGADFNPVNLQPTPENADDVTIYGWLHTGSDMRLYSSLTSFARKDQNCIVIRPLSMAGVVPDSYDGKRMGVTGRIERSGAACGGLLITASDISRL